MLLVPLKKSPEYRTIRPRIANPVAADSWQEGELHFFVFALTTADGSADTSSDPPVVVFTLHPDEPAPISVVVVTPQNNGEAKVTDLRQPNTTYIAPLSVATSSAQHLDTSAQNGHVSAPSTPANERISIEHTQDGRTASTGVAVAPTAQVDHSADASLGGIGEAATIAHSLTQTEHNDTVEVTHSNTPDVNVELLAAVKELPEYQAIQHRLADREPTDAWHEEDAQFFVFSMYQGDEAWVDTVESPVAVFTMNPESSELVAAVVVTPGKNGEADAITNLREQERGYTLSV
jgi:hypothetical protein